MHFQKEDSGSSSKNTKDVSTFFPKRYIYVLLTYVGVAMILGGIVIPLILFHLAGIDIVLAAIYGNIFSFSLSLLIMFFLMRPDFEEERLTSTTSVGGIIGWSFLGVILAFVAQATAATIESSIFKIEMGSENTAFITELVSMTPLFFIVPAIVGPILEELVFRKVIFGSLYKKMNFFFAGTLSAFIFAAAHREFEHILIYAAMGFTFAFLYVKTKRIIVPIIAHMVMNSVVLLLQQLVDVEELERQLEEMKNGIIMIFFGG